MHYFWLESALATTPDKFALLLEREPHRANGDVVCRMELRHRNFIATADRNCKPVIALPGNTAGSSLPFPARISSPGNIEMCYSTESCARWPRCSPSAGLPPGSLGRQNHPNPCRNRRCDHLTRVALRVLSSGDSHLKERCQTYFSIPKKYSLFRGHSTAWLATGAPRLRLGTCAVVFSKFALPRRAATADRALQVPM